MSAYLTPSAGGSPIPLRKSRLYLGKSKTAEPTAPLGHETALVKIELIEGWWHIEDLRAPNGVKVNGRACKREKLAPEDEIEIGRHRYRISFEAPKYNFGRTKSGSYRLAKKRTQKKSSHDSSHTMSGVLGHLVPIGGGTHYPLIMTRVVVGRRPPADLVIRQKTISSTHCEFELVEGYWRIRDLDSRNGIRINGERTDSGWVLPGDRVTISDQRFQLDYVATGPAPLDAAAPADNRSLMDKLGMKDQDLDRVVAREIDDERPTRQRWDVREEEL